MAARDDKGVGLTHVTHLEMGQVKEAGKQGTHSHPSSGPWRSQSHTCRMNAGSSLGQPEQNPCVGTEYSGDG